MKKDLNWNIEYKPGRYLTDEEKYVAEEEGSEPYELAVVKIGNTGFECIFDPRKKPEDDALQIANLIKTAVEHYDELKEVVEDCAKQFRMYEQQHLVKNTHIGNIKAGTNAAAAERCENVLKRIEVAVPGD